MNMAVVPVKVLLVEDSELDAELVLHELSRDDLQVIAERVEDEPAFVEALQRFAPDLVISDLSMPAFSGYRALEIARERSPLTPFMFVSGTMGEEAAVEALRAGATDYVLKQNLARLAAAAKRALAEAAGRRAREQVEQDLTRTQRYESLALLASGLSHDLRNILQPISMAAALLHEDPREDMRKVGTLIEECTRRGLDIVASMLSFARGSHGASERVGLHTLFTGLGMLLRGTVPSAVTLTIDPADPSIELEGNHTELQQCLLNLCLNALQAMPAGGALRLRAFTVVLDDGFFEPDEPAAPGPWLRLEVSDTGIGISDEVRAHLFQPFYTTKVTGTGLGLLSCRRIVGNHRGFLRIRSEQGVGTTFEVYLPLPTLHDAEASFNDIARGNGERVLVVIERAGKLSLLGGMIESHGYQVTLAQDGALALQSLDRDGMPDAVLMDSQMNLMTGVKTLSALLERNFAGPLVLITSRDSTIDEELPPLRRVRRIDKPVDPVQLLAVLAEEIGGARSP
jgi:signal transduction histidine kinase